MVLQLRPSHHLAEYAIQIQTSRRIRVLRDLESHWVLFGVAVHARNKGEDPRGVGPGVFSADETPCSVGTKADTVFLQTVYFPTNASEAGSLI